MLKTNKIHRILTGLLSALLLLALLPIFPAAARPAALVVWTASPNTKIQPTTAAGSSQAISLEGAGASYEAYQIIVTANGQALNQVNLTAGDLHGSGGSRLPAANLTFFRATFIDFTGVSVTEHGNLEVPANSPTSDGRLPDPLIPFIDPYSGNPAGAPFDVAAGLNQPVWLDVYIPSGATPGTYTGAITVTAQGQAPVSLPVSLTVWSFKLPDMNVITPYFQMHVDGLLDYHSGIADCSGSNCWLSYNARARTIVKRYEELGHAHRISTWQNFIPSPDNGCTPPTAAAWNDYDAAMQPYMDGSYWSDGVPSSWLPTPFTPGADWGLQTQCNQAQYTALAAAWAQHLKAKGWFSKAIVYALDEPDDSSLAAIALHSQWMQAGDPDWKAQIMDTTEPTGGNASLLNPALGIYNVCLRCYDGWSYPDAPANTVPYGRAQWPGLFSQGIRLWFYESNAQGDPYPTFATNTLLGAEPRIMMWGAWYEAASGFLLWDITAWAQGAPWGPNISFAKTGDGVLIYPGNHDGLLAPAGSPSGVAIDGPVPSYRLKMVRAGLQDWALFRLAEQYGLKDYARAQVAQAYGQMGGCTWSGCAAPLNGQFFWKTDAALMGQIRHNIAQAIMAQALKPPMYLPMVFRR